MVQIHYKTIKACEKFNDKYGWRDPSGRMAMHYIISGSLLIISWSVKHDGMGVVLHTYGEDNYVQ